MLISLELLWFVVLLLTGCHSAVSAQVDDGNIDIVRCGDQEEACECKQTAAACQFRLEIEELQSFTSYMINSNGNLVTRGTPGDTYYITQNGYTPSVGNERMNISEQGPCWNYGEPIAGDDGFQDMECSIPMMVDGRSYRQFIAVNGRIPGPTLIVSENQIVIVDVFNSLTSEGVSIHWHGIHQRKTPWMDGVGSLSQTPILPGGMFRYIFKASPAGTHWYHSHFGAQRTDGLFGALIVREGEQQYQDIVADVNEDIPGNQPFMDLPAIHTITLLDWQREASIDLFVKIHSTLGFYPSTNLGRVPRQTDSLYNRTRSTDGIEVGPVPYWSGLINGRGRYSSSDLGNLSVFHVNPSTSYRFRLVGAQSLYAYKFEIEGHRLRVIATDGQIVHLTSPLDYIIIHSGERYDFILDTKSPQEISTEGNGNGNYWIRAETLEADTMESRQEHTAEAVLHYSTPGVLPTQFTYDNVANIARQCTQQLMCMALNCPFAKFPPTYYTSCLTISTLRNRFSDDLPRIDIMDSNRLKFFNFGFEGQSSTSAINGRNFRLPPTPYQTYPNEYNDDVEKGRTCQQCNADTNTMSQVNDCTCTYVEKIVDGSKLNDQTDKSVMMVFSAVGFNNNNNRDFSHPIHLHGHSFYVVHVGFGDYDDDGTLINSSTDVVCDTKLCMNPNWRDGTPSAVTRAMSSSGQLIGTAVRKDTVIVPAGGYVVVAFVADNPGYWFLHCHIEVHQLEGMAVIIQEYDESEHNYNLPSDINKPGKFNWTLADFNKYTMANSSRPNSGWSSMIHSHTMILYVGLIISFMIASGM